MSQKSKLGIKELIAIGVGGMMGGGIFSVLGLAVGITGNATPIAFLLGGLLALAAGYSYIKLALAYRGDGASFTYLEHAFPRYPFIGIITGWTVIIGYIGTLALYAFTFGAYGSELLGVVTAEVRQILSVAVILFFMAINLNGVRASGTTEDVIVYSKIILMGLLGVAGLASVRSEELTPLIDRGYLSVFMAGALIFVAYEGFQLITNVVCETDDPIKNIPRGIYGSIAIVVIIYVLLSTVAIGSLPEEQLVASKEYALAVAVEPALGNAGRILISLAALMATSSAINATLLGASSMMAVMATEHALPKPFAFRNHTSAPWMAIVTMSVLTVVFTYFGGLELIAAFSSMTFLLVSLGVSLSNFKLRKKTDSNTLLAVFGSALLLVTLTTLVFYLYKHSPIELGWILVIYFTVMTIEIFFRKTAK